MTLKVQRQEKSRPFTSAPLTHFRLQYLQLVSNYLALLDLLYYKHYNVPMSPRTGRPRTGHATNISLRINPDAYHAARIEAVTARKTVGQWIEEAINEKIEREKEAGNVTKADC